MCPESTLLCGADVDSPRRRRYLGVMSIVSSPSAIVGIPTASVAAFVSVSAKWLWLSQPPRGLLD